MHKSVYVEMDEEISLSKIDGCSDNSPMGDISPNVFKDDKPPLLHESFTVMATAKQHMQAINSSADMDVEDDG